MPKTRPILQGDVFEGVSIPGVDDDEETLAIILTHACTMRTGPSLQSHLMMARIRATTIEPAMLWRRHYRLLPLEDLRGDGANYVAYFEEAGRVASANLDTDRRMACLDDYGVAVLQQRYVNHLTRHEVELGPLHDANAPVLLEVELLEEWSEAATTAATGDWDQAATIREFDDFFNSYRADAREATHRSRIRQDVRREYLQRYPTAQP